MGDAPVPTDISGSSRACCLGSAGGRREEWPSAPRGRCRSHAAGGGDERRPLEREALVGVVAGLGAAAGATRWHEPSSRNTNSPRTTRPPPAAAARASLWNLSAKRRRRGGAGALVAEDVAGHPDERRSRRSRQQEHQRRRGGRQRAAPELGGPVVDGAEDEQRGRPERDDVEVAGGPGAGAVRSSSAATMAWRHP